MVTSIGINDAVIPLQNHPLTLIHYARELGADEDTLIENTGITPKQISEGDHYISYKQYAQLARNAIKELNKPDLGLHFGKELNISSHGIIGFAAMSRATVKDALDVAVKYKKIVSPITRIRYEIEEHKITLFAEQALGVKELEQFFIEALYASLLHGLRYLTNQDTPKVELFFTCSEPEYMDSYKDIFGANATFHFNQASNKMCSEIDFLEQSLALANPVASLAAERQCMEKLDEFSGKEGIISLIRDQLLEEIDHFPSLDEVAQNLHTSVSTLKRKLSEHQTSYQTILDDVRKELALKYLNQNQLTIDDIAQKLQFKEASNFRRAFKKWTGKTPSEYRTS